MKYKQSELLVHDNYLFIKMGSFSNDIFFIYAAHHMRVYVMHIG